VGASLLRIQPVPLHQEVDQGLAGGAGGDGLPEDGAGPVDAEVLGLLQVEDDDLAVELAPFEGVLPQS
jgi:hypothetical protein